MGATARGAIDQTIGQHRLIPRGSRARILNIGRRADCKWRAQTLAIVWTLHYSSQNILLHGRATMVVQARSRHTYVQSKNGQSETRAQACGEGDQSIKPRRPKKSPTDVGKGTPNRTVSIQWEKERQNSQTIRMPQTGINNIMYTQASPQMNN